MNRMCNSYARLNNSDTRLNSKHTSLNNSITSLLWWVLAVLGYTPEPAWPVLYVLGFTGIQSSSLATTPFVPAVSRTGLAITVAAPFLVPPAAR